MSNIDDLFSFGQTKMTSKSTKSNNDLLFAGIGNTSSNNQVQG